ncbi:MAG: RluA family pseudouridine synthase [Alphaproteobacteria bacterium]|nr:RluA family pseudouridine synthase [Alphaproteobacteria bacterium]
MKMIEVLIAVSGRLDKALADSVAADAALSGYGLSRARLQQLVKTGMVRKNGASVVEAKMPVKAGDAFEISLPPPVEAQPAPREMPLDIIFEDDDVIVLNKPAGVVVHPAAGHRDDTLVNALLAHCKGSLSGIGGVARPGIVHRLDKDTSGLLVAAKNDHAHQVLSRQFADRSLSRLYQALVWGVPHPLSGEIEGAIGRHPKNRQKMAVVAHGGKEALTYYSVKEAFGVFASLVECKLATGRTHQIRVHMAHQGYPLIGDPVYGRQRRVKAKVWGDRTVLSLLEAFDRQALHAGELRFLHPKTSKQMKFKVDLPDDFQALLHRIRTEGRA